MSEKQAGGPAFPFACQGPTTEPEIYYGMNLRDHFAAKAMQGLIAADVEFTMSPSVVANLAYLQADEMLKAREA